MECCMVHKCMRTAEQRQTWPHTKTREPAGNRGPAGLAGHAHARLPHASSGSHWQATAAVTAQQRSESIVAFACPPDHPGAAMPFIMRAAACRRPAGGLAPLPHKARRATLAPAVPAGGRRDSHGLASDKQAPAARSGAPGGASVGRRAPGRPHARSRTRLPSCAPSMTHPCACIPASTPEPLTNPGRGARCRQPHERAADAWVAGGGVRGAQSLGQQLQAVQAALAQLSEAHPAVEGGREHVLLTQLAESELMWVLQAGTRPGPGHWGAAAM